MLVYNNCLNQIWFFDLLIMEEVLEIWTVELLKEPGDLKNEVVTYCIYDKKN